jgi:hypothetical protein
MSTDYAHLPPPHYNESRVKQHRTFVDGRIIEHFVDGRIIEHLVLLLQYVGNTKDTREFIIYVDENGNISMFYKTTGTSNKSNEMFKDCFFQTAGFCLNDCKVPIIENDKEEKPKVNNRNAGHILKISDINGFNNKIWQAKLVFFMMAHPELLSYNSTADELPDVELPDDELPDDELPAGKLPPLIFLLMKLCNNFNKYSDLQVSCFMGRKGTFWEKCSVLTEWILSHSFIGHSVELYDEGAFRPDVFTLLVEPELISHDLSGSRNKIIALKDAGVIYCDINPLENSLEKYSTDDNILVGILKNLTKGKDGTLKQIIEKYPENLRQIVYRSLIEIINNMPFSDVKRQARKSEIKDWDPDKPSDEGTQPPEGGSIKKRKKKTRRKKTRRKKTRMKKTKRNKTKKTKRKKTIYR